MFARREGMARHLGMMVVQTVVEAGCLTLAVLPIANIFGPVEWGFLGTLLVAVQLLSMIGDGLYASEVRFISESHDVDSAYSAALGWFLFLITLSIAAGLSALALVGAGLWAETDASQIVLFVLTAAAGLSRVAKSSIETVFRARRDFDNPAMAGICSVIPMAITLFVAAALGGRVASYLAILAMFQTANALWLAWVYMSNMSQNGISAVFDGMKHTARGFISYSWPLMARGVVTFGYLKVNLWLIAWLVGTADAGQYRLADQFLTIPALLMSAALASFAPRISVAQKSDDPNQLLRLSARMYGVMILLSIPFAVGAVFNGIILIPLFPKFAIASQILKWFSIVLLGQGVFFGGSILMVQGGFPVITFLFTLVASIANITFIYFGARSSGLWGTIEAMICVQIVTGVVGVWLAHALLKLPFRVSFK